MLSPIFEVSGDSNQASIRSEGMRFTPVVLSCKLKQREPPWFQSKKNKHAPIYPLHGKAEIDGTQNTNVIQILFIIQVRVEVNDPYLMPTHTRSGIPSATTVTKLKSTTTCHMQTSTNLLNNAMTPRARLPPLFLNQLTKTSRILVLFAFSPG